MATRPKKTRGSAPWSATAPVKRADTGVRLARSRAITPSSGNVFADQGFAPEEAEHLRIRSALMAALRQAIEARGLTQAAAATLLGVSQPRVSDLMRGKIDRFSIDTLVEMLARAGFHVDVRVARVA